METQQAGTKREAFLVEGYWPAGPDTAFREATARLEASLAKAMGELDSGRAIAATLVPVDEAAYWVVDAPSREVVAQACAAAGLRVERILGVLEVRAGTAGIPGWIQRPAAGPNPSEGRGLEASTSTARTSRQHRRRMPR